MSNRERDAAAIIAEECLCFRARRVSRVLTRLYDEELRPLGLQATQLTVLAAIANMEDVDGAAMSRMAAVLAMDLTTLSRNLRPLGKGGLVRIERATNDRRVRVARLTPAGRELLVRAAPAWRAVQDRVVAALGPELAEVLRRSFDEASAAAPRAAANDGRDRKGERR